MQQAQRHRTAPKQMAAFVGEQVSRPPTFAIKSSRFFDTALWVAEIIAFVHLQGC